MKRVERSFWIAAIVFALAPVLLVPSAVTNDGPSHLYNAWVAAEVESGHVGAISAAFRVDRRIGQPLISATVLQWLGPHFGWDLAERVWLGVLLVGLLLAVGWYVHESGAPRSLLTPLLLAWIPLSLVTAWGFYDFLLGAVFFTLLLDALARESLVRIALLLVLLFFSHLFVFTVGLGVTVLRASARKDLRAPAAIAVAAGTTLVLTSGMLGSDLSLGFDPSGRLIQLLFSNVLYSVSPAALLAGTAWTGFLLWSVLRGSRDWRTFIGISLLAAAFVAPAKIAGGSILYERLHLLALISLAPAVASAASRLGSAPMRLLALALVAALSVTFVQWTKTGLALQTDREQITQMLRDSGAAKRGARIGSAFPEREWKVYRAPFHAHLVDRVAIDLSLVAADNHEAAVKPFPVHWNPGFKTIHIRRHAGRVQVSSRPEYDLYVVHDPGTPFEEPGVMRLASGRRFALSLVRGTDRGSAAPGSGVAATSDLQQDPEP